MVDRIKLLNQLKKLSESKFEELLFLLDIDSSHIRGFGVTQSQRAIDVVRYLELEVNGLKGLEETLDDLSSQKNVDYSRLRNLLADGKWKEADEETLNVMLRATGREKEGYLDIESIETFPCADLRTIDRLWIKYSDGRFGFSVQKRIWESIGGKPGEYDYNYDYEIYKKFGDRVGWRVRERWLWYSEYGSLNSPEGHLPGFWRWGTEKGVGPLGDKSIKKDTYLFSRVERCKVRNGCIARF